MPLQAAPESRAGQRYLSVFAIPLEAAVVHAPHRTGPRAHAGNFAVIGVDHVLLSAHQLGGHAVVLRLTVLPAVTNGDDRLDLMLIPQPVDQLVVVVALVGAQSSCTVPATQGGAPASDPGSSRSPVRTRPLLFLECRARSAAACSPVAGGLTLGVHRCSTRPRAVQRLALAAPPSYGWPAHGSNSCANSSGARPDRTNSTICWRNSGAYGRCVLGTVASSFRVTLNVSTKAGQLQCAGSSSSLETPSQAASGTSSKPRARAWLRRRRSRRLRSWR